MSGYSQVERYHAIKGAITRVNIMKDEVKNGVRQSLFRNRHQILESKRTKQVWANTWYLTGNTYGTVSCPVTPGSMLKKIINHEVNNDRMDKLLRVEDGGKPILKEIQVKDPFRP